MKKAIYFILLFVIPCISIPLISTGWDQKGGMNTGADQGDTAAAGGDTDTVIVSYLSELSTNNSYSIICSLFTDTGGIIRLSDSAGEAWTPRDSSGWRVRGGFRDTLSRSGLTQDTKYYYRLIAEDSAGHFDTVAIDSVTTLRNIPIISYASSTCTTDIAFSVDVSSTGGTPDSIVCTSTLPSGLTCTKTGANIGRISGTCVLVAPVARTDYQMIAYNNGGNDTAQFSLAVILNSQIWVDHRHVALYSIIPQVWIDSVMKMQINVPGESHGAGYLYGLELLDSLDDRFVYKDSWATGPISPTTPDSLRGLRIWWRAGTWTNGAGEEDWYTSPDSITRMNRHFKYCNDTLLNRIHVALFGWCWDMTWHNAPEDGRAGVDAVYGCRWAGASVGGPQGDSGWGLDNGDTVLTGNTVTLQTYLAATDYYAAQNPLTKIIFTTGPQDNLTAEENGYQRWEKQQTIRSHVRDSLGRALFDYADILDYNNADVQYVNSTGWTDANDVFHTYPTIQAVNKGDYERDSHLSCHLSDTGVIRIGKAELFLLARVAGWNGTEGDSIISLDSSTVTVIDPAHGTIIPDPVALKRQVGITSTFTLAADEHYHVLDPIWGNDFADSTSNPVSYVFGESDVTISGNIGIDTHYVANTTDDHCQITYLGDSLGAYGETVTLYLQVDDHYLATWPGGTDVNDDTLVVSSNADSTVAATSRLIPAYTIDTVFETYAPITTNHTSLAFDSAFPAPKCTLFCTPGSGYAAIWQGGTVYYPAKDTFIIGVSKDSTVTAVDYLIPVIDSIRDSTALRDSANHQAARPLDTIIGYGSGFSTAGDSTQFPLNSTGSVKGTLLSVADGKFVAIIPAGTPRGWYSSWWRTKDMIVGTPKRHALLVSRPGGL